MSTLYNYIPALRQLCSNGDRYHGRWRLNIINQWWEGNPADLAEVEDLMSSLKHKASSENGNRSHLLPMIRVFMDSMLMWSLKSCPLLETALHALQQAFGAKCITISDLQMNLSKQGLVSQYLKQLTFNATTWTLWTRQVPCNSHV